MTTIFTGDISPANINVTKSFLNNTLNPINKNIKALQTDDATQATSIITITAAGAAEKVRATAAESTLSIGCTALIATSTTKATAAATTLTNQLAVQAAQITALQNTITTLTTTIATLSTTVDTASTAALDAQSRATTANEQSSQNNTTLKNIYNSNGGVLTVQSIVFKYTNFKIQPYQRTDIGESNVGISVLNYDTSNPEITQIYGLYISTSGRCFMDDNGGLHQVRG